MSICTRIYEHDGTRPSKAMLIGVLGPNSVITGSIVYVDPLGLGRMLSAWMPCVAKIKLIS